MSRFFAFCLGFTSGVYIAYKVDIRKIKDDITSSSTFERFKENFNDCVGQYIK